MTGIAARPGVTGAPILAETLTYVEARVVNTLDAEELTIFLADVVGGGRHRSGEPLTLRVLREHLPNEWLAEWATSRERQINEARRRRVGVQRWLAAFVHFRMPATTRTFGIPILRTRWLSTSRLTRESTA